jgi:hypothetical protein
MAVWRSFSGRQGNRARPAARDRVLQAAAPSRRRHSRLGLSVSPASRTRKGLQVDRRSGAQSATPLDQLEQEGRKPPALETCSRALAAASFLMWLISSCVRQSAIRQLCRRITSSVPGKRRALIHRAGPPGMISRHDTTPRLIRPVGRTIRRCGV